jgi:hypothetical protein
MKALQALATLDKFADLKHGWDSYGAIPIDIFVIARARTLLDYFSHIEVTAIAPMSSGGVRIEWDGPPYMSIDIEECQP